MHGVGFCGDCDFSVAALIDFVAGVVLFCGNVGKVSDCLFEGNFLGLGFNGLWCVIEAARYFWHQNAQSDIVQFILVFRRDFYVIYIARISFARIRYHGLLDARRSHRIQNWLEIYLNEFVSIVDGVFCGGSWSECV